MSTRDRTASGVDALLLGAAEVTAVHARFLAGEVPTSDAERVDLLRALEELKSAATAVQAQVAVALDASVRAEEAHEGVPAAKRGRGVPVQLGLALRESPTRARSFLSAAAVWHTEMPHTLAALRSGHLSPWRATILVKETAHLPVEARARIDEEVCGHAERVAALGTAALTGRVKRRAIELDPAAAVERARRAESERAVWIRPAPDTMAYVTALLPVAQGVGVYAALRRAADEGRAAGDERSRGQVMADTLVERVTGQANADAVPVTVNLVMSDATLLGAGSEPALVVDDAGPGGGVLPAQVARNLVANGLDLDAAWLRRLYADPEGRLVAASSVSRFFGDGVAALLRVRDQGLCRTPYCDAPIRHLDHVTPASDGGPTDQDNGQGLCEGCNQAKNSGALTQTTETSDGRHTVLTRTATGHRYRTTAPPPPRAAPPPRSTVRSEPATGSEAVTTSGAAPSAGPETRPGPATTDGAVTSGDETGTSPVEQLLSAVITAFELAA